MENVASDTEVKVAVPLSILVLILDQLLVHLRALLFQNLQPIVCQVLLTMKLVIVVLNLQK